MLDCTDGYRHAIIGDARKMYLLAIINMISPEITYGTVSADSHSAYSKPATLHDKKFSAPKRYATGEPGRWPLDGTVDILPDGAAELTGGCFLGGEMSGAGGAFSTPAWVEMAFSNVSILQACSVWFSDDPLDGVPADFTVEVKQGGTVYYAKTFTGNTEAGVSMEGFTVNNPDAIRVTVTKWSIPYRRFRVVEIVPGIYERWTDDMLCEFSISQEISPSCLSIPYGTATLKMDNMSRRFEPRKKSGLFQSIEEGQEIPVSIGVQLSDGSVEYKPVGVYYQHNAGWKTGDNDLSIQWSLVDIIGLLADRDFVPPATLPTTLSGWLACLVSQLGSSFAAKYKVDAAYANAAVTAQKADDVKGKKCGEILRYACMAAGVFPRADDATGCLTADPLWAAGNYLDLDNMNTYPTMKANDDVSGLTFKLHDGTENGTAYTVSGNNSAAQPLNIDNPFIHTQVQAIAAARNILSTYGGNQIETSSRGNPSDELGDVSKVQLDESSATSARRTKQGFSFSDGALCTCPSTLIQPDGSYLYQSCAIIAADGMWTAPDGVTTLRVILVGGGTNGTDGTDGSFESTGEAGIDGAGGKVWAETIQCNAKQQFSVHIGAAGEATTFGAYSSANGTEFDSGYSDIGNGNVYARTGVEVPKASSGDGGKGGMAGTKGEYHFEEFDFKQVDGTMGHGTRGVTDVTPGKGTKGVSGGSGCVIIYYDKAVTA